MEPPRGRSGPIGRDAELATLRAALSGHRLVTVTGGAGVGKSRLALEAAARPSGGPWQAMVRVRGSVGPWTLERQVARALNAVTGPHGFTASPDLAAVVRALPAGGLLLVLDDVDPVLGDCPGLVRSLLAGRPDLRILVTARQPLGLAGEHVLRLAAAPSPYPGVGELAVRLQRGRCRPADPAPGRAVGRLRPGGASIASVHASCDEPVRKVWRRLSVFTGAFTESAAVFVCEGADLSPAEIPPALAVLTSVGVLRAHDGIEAASEPRHVMARAARAFGGERLVAAEERAAAGTRHARHCRSTAAVAEILWNTGLQQQAVDLVRAETADLAGFFDRAVEDPAHAETAVEALLHLWFWWAAHNRGREGARRLLALLPLLPAGSEPAARGQWLAGWLVAGEDPAGAQRLLGRAWPAAVLSGHDALVGRIAHAYGTLAWKRRDLTAAAAYYRHAADTIPSGAPGGPGPATSLAALAVVQATTAPALAVRTARRALAQPTGGHDAWTTALAHYAHALADHHAGRTGRARHRARRALARLDARLDAPQARVALRKLLRHLAHPGAPGHPAHPADPPSSPPSPRTRSTTEPTVI
ncbi:hypothetical protein ABT117_29165 [Streptomyces sp. NPDC002262]|uniref:hypothetical protein n=1 Tax=Streptomyces sp. NPDC002262 TaxID=3154414 RepID=UPI0033186450